MHRKDIIASEEIAISHNYFPNTTNFDNDNIFMVRKFSTEKSKEITIKVGYPTFHAADSGMMIHCSPSAAGTGRRNLIKIQKKEGKIMKNKRNVLIAFILICCLCLSIGYAALTDTLYVNGAMTIDTDGGNGNDTPVEKAFDKDIYYANAIVATSGKEGHSEVGTADQSWAVISDENPAGTNDILTITIPTGILNVVGDTVTVTVDVKNDSQDLAASVVQSAIIEGINPDFFNVSAYWTELGANGGNTCTIPANSSKNVTIVIELAKSPTADVTGSFSFTHVATANTNDTVQQPATP